MKAAKILVGLLVAIGVLAFLSVIIVKEVNQAIILQFGDPKRIIMKPGLSLFKTKKRRSIWKFNERKSFFYG